MRLVLVGAFALLFLGAPEAGAWDVQEMYVPQNGIEGQTEIRKEFGVFCKDRISAERLIRTTAQARKPEFAYGSMTGLSMTAESEETTCGLDQLIVAGVFPSGKLAELVIVPVRLIEAKGPEVRYLVMK